MEHSYDYAKINAWKYLLRHEVKGQPDIFELCKRDGIVLLPYSERKTKYVAEKTGSIHMMKYWGFAFCVNGIPLIFFDDSQPSNTQVFTVAHEIGHLVNGDVGSFLIAENTPCITRWFDLLRELKKIEKKNQELGTTLSGFRIEDDSIEIAADIFALWLLAGSDMINA